MDTPHPEVLLTIPDAAKVLAVSRAKLYQLISDGTVPSVKIGGSRRIRSGALQAFIESLEVAA